LVTGVFASLSDLSFKSEAMHTPGSTSRLERPLSGGEIDHKVVIESNDANVVFLADTRQIDGVELLLELGIGFT
jgi:hypothetical protein